MRRHLSFFLVALIGFGLITLAVISYSGKKSIRAKNLVVISIDTLRADRLSIYGYERNTSPVLDRFSQAAVVFERAVTASPWTLPSHLSMLSGLYPHTHGVIGEKRAAFPANKLLLAQVLKRRGYATIGLSGAAYLSSAYGFGRGFDTYLYPQHYMPKAADRHFTIKWTVQKAKEELQKVPKDQPYFLFLHTYDVHCPYEPPPSHKGMFTTPGAKEIDASHCRIERRLKRRPTKEEALYLSDRYDESIRAVDEHLESLFNYLKSRDDYKETAIIVTSDHGEEFLEHGQVGHTKSLHNELLFVPLIMRLPDTAPRRVPQHVSLIDIVPSVLELLDIDDSPKNDGVSLIPLATGEFSAKNIRPFEYSELYRGKELRSRIDNMKHLILDVQAKKALFFDFNKDPLETMDLSSIEPELFNRQFEELQLYVDSMTYGTPDSNNSDSNREHLKALKTLGYF